jgi:hypothetical protein
LRVAAAIGATPQVTALPVVVTLPNSNPPANVTYTLYVQAIGVPDLQVVSVTPSRTLSAAAPWLSGEALDFTVVVRNGGNTASAGNEILTVNLNGYQVDPGARGAAVKVPSLGPGASTPPFTVHAIAPDAGAGALSSGTLVAKVATDTAGDLNYGDNSLTQAVAVSNWRLAVGNPGLSDAAPLVVTITANGPSWSNQAVLTGTVDNGGATALNFIPAPGVVGSKLSIPLSGFAPGAGPNSFLVTVLTGDNTTQSGLYPAQVIVQLMDPLTGAVTAQRQATIHVQVTNTVLAAPNYALGLTCTHNGSSCVAGTGPATAIQVNGALTEPFIATVVPSCTPAPGVLCLGTADIVITDGINTTTTPPQAKGQPFNSAAVFQVTANQDANGNITTGAAGGYSITLNGIQRSLTATSPDPVGQTFPVPVNVGDIIITTNAGANGCTAVAPNGPPVQLTVNWSIASMGGFNVPTISWEWENANHVAVGATPLGFSSPSGTSSGAPNYSNPPAFTISNIVPNVPGTPPPPDGLQLYFFAATVSNGTSSATKYFPFYFDASLSQNFCGAAGAARGSFTRINGSWSRGAVVGAIPAPPGPATGSVDLHVSATDVSYTPSMPKAGDTVQVRFRVRNDGAADAKGVPIALQVNGVTVASDTFDVGAGRTTLGGLQWNSASVPVSASPRPSALRPARIGAPRPAGAGAPVHDAGGDSLGRPAGLKRVSALLVIDPQHTVRQTTTLDKSAPLAHFTMNSGDGGPGPAGMATGPSQRLLLEIQEGACAGMRLSTGGVGPCGSADLELTIADIAKGVYMLNADSGVADLGTSFGGVAQGTPASRGSSELAGAVGHSYSVQLNGGRTAVIAIDSIRNPRQLDAATRAVFRSSAIQVMRGLGSDSGAASTGDVAGGIRGGATVFVQLSVQVQ